MPGWREQLQAVIDAGHPADALVGVPVSLIGEILRTIPVVVVPAPAPTSAQAA